MTKIILHGGFTREKNDLNAGYYREIVKDLKDGDQVLSVLFAREEKDYEELLADEKDNLLSRADGKDLKIVLATEENFINQVKDSEAIVVRGGSTDQLLATIKKYPEFEEAIKGKVIAGSSAGAYLFCRYYHSASTGEVREGLGLLPLRVVCHYQSETGVFDVGEEAIEKINQYDNSLELVVLKDFEWKVFEV